MEIILCFMLFIIGFIAGAYAAFLMVRDRLEKSVDLALDAVHTDGGHHKQWFLWKILKVLGYNTDSLDKTAEKGIAP